MGAGLLVPACTRRAHGRRSIARADRVFLSAKRGVRAWRGPGLGTVAVGGLFGVYLPRGVNQRRVEEHVAVPPGARTDAGSSVSSLPEFFCSSNWPGFLWP